MTLKIKLTEEFLKEIEDIFWEIDCTYIEAVIEWCTRNNTEVDSIGELIKRNAVLKAKIQLEAEDLNFLPKSAQILV